LGKITLQTTRQLISAGCKKAFGKLASVAKSDKAQFTDVNVDDDCFPSSSLSAYGAERKCRHGSLPAAIGAFRKTYAKRRETGKE
jgi:hypothetical protein